MIYNLFPLLGGILIGLSVSLMLYLNGRITGVSGIINGLFSFKKNDFLWRLSFVLGLITAGFFLKLFWPETITSSLVRTKSINILAGLLVGFGTVMGGGCTSGHGICGLSRGSIRSVVATIIFMALGILAATFFRVFLESYLI